MTHGPGQQCVDGLKEGDQGLGTGGQSGESGDNCNSVNSKNKEKRNIQHFLCHIRIKYGHIFKE